MFRNPSRAASAIAALAFAALGAAANAQTASPASSDPDASFKRVSVADLDLGQAAGARAALGRIRMAAVDVCGGQPSPLELDRVGDFKLCVQAAIDGAVAQLRSPLATAMNVTAPGRPG